MDTSQLIDTAAKAIQAVVALSASGVGLMVLTQLAKKIQSFPISAGQTVRIRAFVGVLSAVAAAVFAWLDGTLDAPTLGGVIEAVSAFALVWLTADGSYQALKK